MFTINLDLTVRVAPRERISRKGEAPLESRDKSDPKRRGRASAREQAAKSLVARRFPYDEAR